MLWKRLIERPFTRSFSTTVCALFSDVFFVDDFQKTFDVLKRCRFCTTTLSGGVSKRTAPVATRCERDSDDTSTKTFSSAVFLRLTDTDKKKAENNVERAHRKTAQMAVHCGENNDETSSEHSQKDNRKQHVVCVLWKRLRDRLFHEVFHLRCVTFFFFFWSFFRWRFRKNY